MTGSRTAFDLVVLVSGVVFALAPLLQRRRILHRGSCADVSLAWLGLYAAGCTVLLLYGIVAGSWVLIASQATGLGAALATIDAARRQLAGAPVTPSPAGTAGTAGAMAAGRGGIASELTVSDALRQATFAGAETKPVVDHDQRVVGTLCAANLTAVELSERSSTLVRDVASPVPEEPAPLQQAAPRVPAWRQILRVQRP
ncbi:MAG: hypothetical protein ACXVFL_12770 [Solirubrobacteraceae bacterium]